MAQLQQEQQMLLQKQQELNRKMNMLQAAKPADVPSRASTEQETEEPEQSSEEGDDKNPDQGDWGLGTVLCPRTGKVSDQHMDSERRLLML